MTSATTAPRSRYIRDVASNAAAQRIQDFGVKSADAIGLQKRNPILIKQIDVDLRQEQMSTLGAHICRFDHRVGPKGSRKR